jgi:2-(1,2-epoxy-1,2-dihydrophenyl)acetyl-CoA isomerase
MSETVLVTDHGAVRVMTLNRPDRLNALTAELLMALSTAMQDATAARSVRAIVLTGAGRGFCAGADLNQNMGGEARDLGVALDTTYNPLVLAMRACPKPIVSAVNGVAAGAGMNLALAGDIVIAARAANFTQAFVRIGLMPDAGGTYFLPRLVGDGRARAMMMLGETMTAAQAEAVGLVWKLYDDEHFAAEALAMATSLAARPAGALAAMKAALNASAGNTLSAQLNVERDHQRDLGYSADFAEGVKAFIEKRPAMFS